MKLRYYLTYCILLSVSVTLAVSLFTGDLMAFMEGIVAFLGWFQVSLYERDERKRDAG